MVYQRAPQSVGFSGLSSRPSADVVVLVATLLGTFALQFFAASAAIPELLRLSWGVFSGPFVWQVVTYPFVGWGGGGLSFILELLIVYMFANDVFARLGRRRFWKLLVGTSILAGLAALAVDAVRILTLGPAWTRMPFVLIQGQHMVLVVLITAFAVLWRNATVLLFFVLPVPARVMAWLGVVLGFVYFLPTHDLAGFVGICTATAITWWWLGAPRPGSPRPWLRINLWWNEMRLRRARRRSRLRIVKNPKPPIDLTVN